jgi:hypothetical protein
MYPTEVDKTQVVLRRLKQLRRDMKRVTSEPPTMGSAIVMATLMEETACGLFYLALLN